jgi:S1-C subfamily serine protease
MSKGQVAVLFIGLGWGMGNAQGQSSYVYLIKASNHKHVDRAFTGFRVRGQRGIVTALHGVADANPRSITATNMTEKHVYTGLKLAAVDIDHDLAFLTSSDFHDAKHGLQAAKGIQWNNLSQVKVVGYPLNLDLSSLTTILSVRKPARVRLRTLVDPETRNKLNARHSPNPSILVLSVQGQILPGHSGAPILDGNGRVVAVADGGLLSGLSGITWAIPLEEIQWQSVKGNNALAYLRQKDSGTLFSYTDEIAQIKTIVEELRKELKEGIGRNSPDQHQENNVSPRATKLEPVMNFEGFGLSWRYD